jgi:hypothetical protein
MPVAVKLAIACASFLANFLILAGAILVAGGLEGAAAIIAVFLLGFSVGCVLGSRFRTPAPLAVGAGALAAALLLYTPVVLATYGFALFGLPLLLLYAVCVGSGAHMVRRQSIKQPHSS